MKATLEFVLSAESQEFRDAINGASWRRVVTDLFAFIKETGDTPNIQPAEKEMLSLVWDTLARLMRESTLYLPEQ